MTISIKKWDATSYLKTADDVAAYLEAVAEDGDAKEWLRALDIVSRSDGMQEIIRIAGLNADDGYGR
ncbi:MAG: DNA-binding protein [Rhizobiaceae bacterium]